ncbi:hypothetical protein C8J57DRAFT_196474 [Mycena rebaudengoi]|nr:hypothetical protein C8J57DRAFT_196474 [Mycena rebaudengoi]
MGGRALSGTLRACRRKMEGKGRRAGEARARSSPPPARLLHRIQLAAAQALAAQSVDDNLKSAHSHYFARAFRIQNQPASSSSLGERYTCKCLYSRFSARGCVEITYHAQRTRLRILHLTLCVCLRSARFDPGVHVFEFHVACFRPCPCVHLRLDHEAKDTQSTRVLLLRHPLSPLRSRCPLGSSPSPPCGRARPLHDARRDIPACTIALCPGLGP